LADYLKFCPQNRSIGRKEDPYLWMCELQRWLRDVHKIDAFVNPIETLLFENRSYQSRVLTKTSITIGGVYDSYEKSLEVALESALKLIK